MFLCLRAGGGAPWRLQGDGSHHGWGVFVVLSRQKCTMYWFLHEEGRLSILTFLTPRSWVQPLTTTRVKPHSVLTKSPNGFLDSILSVAMQYSSVMWTHIMREYPLAIQVCRKTCLFIFILSVVKVRAKDHFFFFFFFFFKKNWLQVFCAVLD